MSTKPASFDVQRLRSRIPALASGTAFFDGPGGTQTPDLVAQAVFDTMVGPLSNRGRLTPAERNADDITARARVAMADLLGSPAEGIVFGRSATALAFDMARTLAQDWEPGDEVIVTRLDHDANIRPWVRAAERAGAEVRWAPFDPRTAELDSLAIGGLLSDRTRLVAVTGASNLLGTRPDLRAIGALVRQTDAVWVVDGVHLTAHALIDLADMQPDAYLCSPYKFLGPHLGILAASPAFLSTLHPDKLRPSTEQVPERFELGTLPYEMLAGVTAAVNVLADLVPGDEATLPRRTRIVRSLAALQAHEHALHERLRSGLAGVPGIQLFSNSAHRTPTELFALAGRSSAEVSIGLAERGVNAPAGSFYALEAAEWLGLGEPGAVRAGLAPYTNADDVDRLVAGVLAVAAAG